MIDVWDNVDRAAQCANTTRPLTHSLDLREEGLAMKATRTCSVTDCDRQHFVHGYCRGHSVRWERYGDPLAGRPLTPERPCAVDDCSRPSRTSDLCTLHYQRHRRNGTTEKVRIRGTCSIEGCDRPHLSRGWCGLHYGRWERNGDPLTVLPNPASMPGEQNSKWLGDDIGYTAAHDRVRGQRGSASTHDCVDCGIPAEEWSYDHLDPAELVERNDPKRRPYSANLDHYQPRCLRCHWRIDHPSGGRTRA